MILLLRGMLDAVYQRADSLFVGPSRPGMPELRTFSESGRVSELLFSCPSCLCFRQVRVRYAQARLKAR